MGSHRAHTLITRHFIKFYSIPCLNTTTCMLFLRDYWPDPTFSRCCPIHCNRASRARARTQVFVPQGNRSHWSPNPSRLLSHLRNLLSCQGRRIYKKEMGHSSLRCRSRGGKNRECDAPQRTCWQNHHGYFLHERSTSSCQALDSLE